MCKLNTIAMITVSVVTASLGVSMAARADYPTLVPPAYLQAPPTPAPSPTVAATPVGQGYDRTTNSFYTDVATVRSDGTITVTRIPRVGNSNP